MKIAIDGLNIRKGGGETVMMRLARAFRRAGHEVAIFTGSPELAERVGNGSEATELIPIPAAASALGALKVRHGRWERLMAEHGCDAVLGFNYWVPTRLPQATYHINVIPFLPLAERRAAVGWSRAFIQRRYALAALARSTLNIFESRHVLSLAQDACRGPISRPEVRHIGVDLPQGIAMPEQPEHTLAAVTSPAFHKHNEYLFDLHRELGTRLGRGQVGLKLIGIGPEAFDANERMAARKEYALAQDDIEFLGYVDRDRLYRELASSLALVSFSELESFFMVALEAMAVGCPAIATDVSSISESVGNAGLLVPPGDVAAAADHVEALLDPQVRNHRQAVGLDWASRFEAEACADRIVELCEQLESDG